MKLCILLACAFAYVGCVKGQGPGLLFPHMAGNDDTLLVPEDDDISVSLELSGTYGYYYSSYNTMYIGTNGYVTFGGGEWKFFPRLMSEVTTWPRTMIAPLFGDNMLDPTPPNNNVWYRETDDLDMLTKANDIIQAQFPSCGGSCFTATWVTIVTWQRLKSYCKVTESPDSPGCDEPYTPLRDGESGPKSLDGGRLTQEKVDESGDRGFSGINGYQLVLATDGTMTFAIFNMHTIEWDCCFDYNTSGFSAGDSSRSCDLPGSGTAAIVDLTTGSNVGEPGRWVYRVDGCDVLEPDCGVC